MSSQETLGRHLRQFLGDHLPEQRSASPRTVCAYRDALKLLLQHVAKEHSCSVADLNLSDVDRSAVLTFLSSIEDERGNSVATRNHRLAAIRSFFRFVSNNELEAVEQCTKILAIPVKRGESRSIDYLTIDEVHSLLRQVRVDSKEGVRDDALLRLLYNTGARVQEAIDVRASDLRLDGPAHVLLHGKGRKERLCPLWPDTVGRLKILMASVGAEATQPAVLFKNERGQPLTRSGVRYILAKYTRRAAVDCPSLKRKNVHPHTLRHTTAMHLLQAGVDLNTIRCWLGHASITTTNRYVEIDLDMKRAALERVAPPSSNGIPAVLDSSLLAWLESI